MTLPGWVGLWVTAIMLVVITAELLVAWLRWRQLRRRWLRLQSAVAPEVALLLAELERAEQLAGERGYLLAPLLRVRERLRHPVLRAAFELYRK